MAREEQALDRRQILVQKLSQRRCERTRRQILGELSQGGTWGYLYGRGVRP